MVNLNYGHYLQIIWLIVGLILQIWIGGIKGFVVLVVGAIMFLINLILMTIKNAKVENLSVE